MKTSSQYYLLLLLFLLSLSPISKSNAQIDKATKKQAEKLFKKQKTDTTNKAQQEEDALKLWKDMATRGERGEENKQILNDIRDSYRFDKKLHYTMEVTDKKGNKNAMDLIYLIKEGSNYIGLQPINNKEDNTKIISVFDNDNDVLVNFTQDKQGYKQAIAMRLQHESELKADETDIEPETTESDRNDYSDLEFKNTGNIKDVNGYICKEYIAENKETKIHLWLAEVGFPTFIMPLNSQKELPNMNKILGDIPEGKSHLMIEMELNDKLENTQSKLELKDMSDIDKKINCEEYNILPVSRGMNYPMSDEKE